MNNDTPFILTLDPGIERMNPQVCDLMWLVTNLSYGAFLKREDALRTQYYYFWPDMFTVTVNTDYYANLANKNPFSEAMSKLSGYDGVLAQQKRGMIGTPIQRAILLGSPFFKSTEYRSMLEGFNFDLAQLSKEFQKSKPTVVIPKEGFLPWYASGEAVRLVAETQGHAWDTRKRDILSNATFFPVPGFPDSGRWPCPRERAIGNLLQNCALNQFGIDHVYTLSVARFIQRHDIEVWLTGHESRSLRRLASDKAERHRKAVRETHLVIEDTLKAMPTISDEGLASEIVGRMGNNFCRHIPYPKVTETGSKEGIAPDGTLVTAKVAISHDKVTYTRDVVQEYLDKRREKNSVEAVTVDEPAKKNPETPTPATTNTQA